MLTVLQREEKFFSRLVTHVVTSRPVPPEAATTSPAELESGADTGNGDGHMQTVNPSLLEKNADAHLHMSLKPEHRRDQGSMDVLQRARQMGMKIWALEKLQRMIATINDSEIGSQHDTSRNKTAGGSTVHGKGENDLSRVLRQELLNGPSDRDPLSSMEMLIFKGPFVYIHDMNEKTKPVMVREYSRVARRQDGTWPQFRSAPLGKCPFIDEPPTRKSYDRQRMRQQQKEKKAVMTKVDNLRGANHTTTITERATETKPVKDIARPRSQENLGQRVSPPMQTELQRKPSLEGPHKRKSSESFIPPHFPPKGPFYAGREPAASGVQPSNITSAIRSQMISSTAAAPGAKAGLSKEVHGLKRKLLEKGTGSIVTGSMAAPQRYANGSAMHQSVKRQGHQAGNSNLLDKHRHANADANQADDTGAKRHRDETLDSQQKKSQPPRDPKPGYCENCRDKFDDFEEVGCIEQVSGGMYAHHLFSSTRSHESTAGLQQMQPTGPNWMLCCLKFSDLSRTTMNTTTNFCTPCLFRILGLLLVGYSCILIPASTSPSRYPVPPLHFDWPYNILLE